MSTHTGRYGDTASVPVGVMASVAGYVTREWSDYGYRVGYIGCRFAEDDYVFAFQIKTSDGSRFAVGSTLYGDPCELTGDAWFAWLQDAGIEASVNGVAMVAS